MTIPLRGLRPNTFYGNRNIAKTNSTYTQCEWDENNVYTTCDPFYKGYGNIATAPNGLFYNARQNMEAHARFDDDWNVLNAGQKFAVNTDVLYVGAQVVYKAKAIRPLEAGIERQIAPLSYNAVHIPDFTTKPKGSGSAVAFTDVNSGTPHADDIQWLAANKISEGYKNPNGTYRFEGMTSVYRQDMAAFLRREAVKRGISDAASWKPSAADRKRFRDVTCAADNKGNKNTPHCEDILWLAHAGISEGWKEKDGSSTFRGMDTVKRQDMAAFLKRLATKAGKGGNVKPKTDFTDVTAGTPHKAEIQWLGGSGISEGYRNANGTWRFEGMTSVYRQDMAAFIHRLDNLLGK
ncbi:internalin [Bifidobacterium pseudolongum subsp. globosum]|nr:internalin [Bifidobacterium pseudolongum subsp. globosum]